jgi:hypothetical protein
MAGPSNRSGGLSGLAGALVFLAFVVAGSGYIVWAKLAELPAMLVTLVPVAVMVAYAVVSLVLRPSAGSEDMSGDNAYYMGFLFTLTSLAVSLWQFDADGRAEAIVRNFGVAIASTIAGIALRVFINQMRQDPVGAERGARVDLADAARRVRRELDATVLDLGHFRRGTQQAAAESWSAVREEVAGTARALVGELASAADPMREAARRSGDEMDALSVRIDALGAALDRFTARLDGMTDPVRLSGDMQEQASGTVAAFERLIVHLDRHGDQLAAVNARLAALSAQLATVRLDGQVDASHPSVAEVR